VNGQLGQVVTWLPTVDLLGLSLAQTMARLRAERPDGRLLATLEAAVERDGTANVCLFNSAL
jgi:hypothetical protein